MRSRSKLTTGRSGSTAVIDQDAFGVADEAVQRRDPLDKWLDVGRRRAQGQLADSINRDVQDIVQQGAHFVEHFANDLSRTGRCPRAGSWGAAADRRSPGSQ